MKTISCIALLTVASVAATASPPARAETQLRQRVLRYHAHFLSGNAAKMWEMSSRKLRRENDHDKAAFIKQMPKIPNGHGKTKLISLKVSQRTATARIQFDLLPVGGDKWLTEIYDETWVFERGNWFFDTYRLAPESPPFETDPSQSMLPNKSLDASGGSVFRNLICPAMLD